MTVQQPNLSAAQPDWLLRLACDHYKLSAATSRSPGSRASNRRKFIELVKQLLPLIGKERMLARFIGYDIQCDTTEARAIIAELASEMELASERNEMLRPAEPTELTTRVAEGLEQLAAALRDWQGGAA